MAKSNKSNQNPDEPEKSKTPQEKMRERLGRIDQTKVLSNKALSTGSVFLDLNINPRMPGFKCGKAHVVAGRPGSGKSSLMFSMARDLLAKNKPGDPNPRIVVYIDVENGTDESQLALYGLTKYDTPNFEYKVCNYGPDVLRMVEEIIRDYQGCETEVLIVIDSIPHLSFSDAETTNDYSKTAAVAQGPNKLKVFFRENKALLANTNICLMCLSFMTANIGRQHEWEPKFVLSGGSFMEYAADVAIVLTAKGKPRETEVPPPSEANGGKPAPKPKGLGKFQDISLGFLKQKTGAKLEIDYILCLIEEPGYKPGILDLNLMVDYACKKGGIQSGAWIKLNGGQWQGKGKFKEALRESIQATKDGIKPADEAIDGLHQALYTLVRSKIFEERRIKE